MRPHAVLAGRLARPGILAPATGLAQSSPSSRRIVKSLTPLAPPVRRAASALRAGQPPQAAAARRQPPSSTSACCSPPARPN